MSDPRLVGTRRLRRRSAPHDPQPGKKKRPPPGRSVAIVATYGARMFIDTGNGPSMWVDAEPQSDHVAGQKPVEIAYLLLKRAGVVLFQYVRQETLTDTAGIFASLPNDAVAIHAAQVKGGSARFNALNGKNFNGLRIYKLNRDTQAVVQGWTLDTVAFNSWTFGAKGGRNVDEEILTWTYNPLGMEPYTDVELLQADGRRVAHDEGVG